MSWRICKSSGREKRFWRTTCSLVLSLSHLPKSLDYVYSWIVQERQLNFQQITITIIIIIVVALVLPKRIKSRDQVEIESVWQNSLQVAKRKRKTADSNLPIFTILSRCSQSHLSIGGGLETENHEKNKSWNHEYLLLHVIIENNRLFLEASSSFWSQNTKNNLLNS